MAFLTLHAPSALQRRLRRLVARRRFAAALLRRPLDAVVRVRSRPGGRSWHSNQGSRVPSAGGFAPKNHRHAGACLNAAQGLRPAPGWGRPSGCVVHFDFRLPHPRARALGGCGLNALAPQCWSCRRRTRPAASCRARTPALRFPSACRGKLRGLRPCLK